MDVRLAVVCARESATGMTGVKTVYLRGGGREQYGSNPHWRSAASLVKMLVEPD